ncbi:MAG: hypothetical protein M1832_000725 [Thelocarpon impressellum]|nr:MAG: hypothetical protein M1832_000725 [Thelocarpon impressellum]
MPGSMYTPALLVLAILLRSTQAAPRPGLAWSFLTKPVAHRVNYDMMCPGRLPNWAPPLTSTGGVPDFDMLYVCIDAGCQCDRATGQVTCVRERAYSLSFYDSYNDICELFCVCSDERVPGREESAVQPDPRPVGAQAGVGDAAAAKATSTPSVEAGQQQPAPGTGPDAGVCDMSNATCAAAVVPVDAAGMSKPAPQARPPPSSKDASRASTCPAGARCDDGAACPSTAGCDFFCERDVARSAYRTWGFAGLCVLSAFPKREVEMV